MASKFSFDNAGSVSDNDGSNGDDGGAIDPTALASGNGAGNGDDSGSGGSADEYIRDDAGNILYSPTGRARKRRAKRGTGNAGKSSAQDNRNLGKNIDRLSAMLGFAHLAMSNGFKVPELKLDKVESDMLASSVVDVMAAFDIEVSDKAMAISGLVSACGTIYAPRAISYKMRKDKEREESKPLVFPSKTAQFAEKPDDILPPGAFDLGG